jgi:hypothetical protein
MTESRGSTPSDRGSLLPWQLAHYPQNHLDRRNLILHVLTVPLFMLGNLALLAALPLMSGWLALAGALAMLAAIAIQGRGHRREVQPPMPFRGPLDVFARILAEQWVTFPRFVLSGGFARAWRSI